MIAFAFAYALHLSLQEMCYLQPMQTLLVNIPVTTFQVRKVDGIGSNWFLNLQVVYSSLNNV